MLLHLCGQNILHWQQELSGNDIYFLLSKGETIIKLPSINVHHFGGSGDAWRGYLVWRDSQCNHVELLQGNNISL